MMKKRSIFSSPLFPFSRAAAVSLAFVALVLAGALSSCDLFSYKDPFPPEYYADNWIDTIGFGVFVGADAYTPGDPETTGSWDFEYRYDTWDNNDYIDFTAAAAPYDTAGDVATTAGETLPAGLPATAPVYRLELVNLISDGDFEVGTGGVWTNTSGATYARDTAGKIGAIGSMKLSAVKDSSLTYVPNFTFAIVDGREYHYSVNVLSDKGFSITDANGNSQSTAINLTVKTIGGSFQRSTLNFLQVKPMDNDSFGQVFLDDFRVSRSKGMRLRLRLCPGETKYDMLKGPYRFTVWAHLDPTVITDVNPYDIDGFTVTMIAAGTATNIESTTATYSAAAASSGWVMLSINSDKGALIFDESVLDEPVLDIVIEFNTAHSGRVLLAAPELRYGRSY
jgi:hypothetical protein